MSLNAVPRPFFVLESAPTSDDESEDTVKNTVVNPRTNKPLPKAVFTTSRPALKPAPHPVSPAVQLTPPRESSLKRRRSSADSLARMLSDDESADQSTIRTTIPLVTPVQAAFETLDSSLSLDALALRITCVLCEGLMRHPQCMLDCMHTCKSYSVCKVCVFRWMIENNSINKCPICKNDVAAST